MQNSKSGVTTSLLFIAIGQFFKGLFWRVRLRPDHRRYLLSKVHQETKSASDLRRLSEVMGLRLAGNQGR